MPDAKETLLQWCKENKLQDATLSEDGGALSLGDTSLNAKDTISISSSDGKTIEYSLASIFLQILDPNIGLLKYRAECKKYNVNDQVKAKDKPVVVGYFLPSSSQEAAAAPDAVAPPAAAAPAEATSKPSESDSAKEAAAHRKRSSTSGSSSRDKHDKHRSSSSSNRDKHDKKRPSSSSHHRDSRDKHEKKKRRSLVTNEQLFSNLNVVVDKRATGDETGKEASEEVVEEQLPKSEASEAIRKALSTKGFEVTPEMLEKYREKTEKEIIANEIPVGDSASVLRAASVGANLTRVLNLFMETVNPSKSHKKGAAPPSAQKTMRRYLIGKKPIIIVPKGMTAPITINNAYDFFANARFIPRDVMMKNKALQANAKKTTFTRKMPNVGLIEYELLDNPRKLQTKQDWERVVAVVVLGHSWQFKDWPGKYSNPVDLFANAFGFYIGMEGDKLPSDLEGWACQRGFLHRDKRGLDSVSHASFWNSLDEWMKINRPELLPQPE